MIRLLEIDKPTSRGVIYPRVVVEEAIKAHVARLGKNQMGIFRGLNIVKEDMVGVAENLRIEDDYLVADVGITQEFVNEMGAAGHDHLTLRPIGHGVVNPISMEIGEGYEFHALTVRTKPLVVGATIYEKK